MVVDNEEIKKETLSKYILRFKDDCPLAYSYYQILTAPTSSVRSMTENNFCNLGELDLKIMNGAEFATCRRVLVAKQNGMKIMDQGNLPQGIYFAAICQLKSDNINAYFKKMENPEHNSWEPYRLPESEQENGKMNLKRLKDFISGSIKENANNKTEELVDAEGVGEFLPDTIENDDEDENIGYTQTAMGDTDNIELERKQINKNQTSFSISNKQGAQLAESTIDQLLEESDGDLDEETITSKRKRKYGR